jgi:hypothetical protein
MPEMFQYCGKRFRVFKRAHKTCDTVFPIRGRRMAHAVHLETRCTGDAHGGCQAGCLIFWKEAWLKRVDAPATLEDPIARRECTEEDVRAGTFAPDSKADSAPVYACQATQLPYATTSLAWWDYRQYVEDWVSGNVSAWQLLKGAVYSVYSGIANAGIGLSGVMRWLYDTFRPLWRGTRFPRTAGLIPLGEPTPTLSAPLDLRPGEWVRVRSHEEILHTVNTANKNRGLYFDAEMVPFCGGTYRVLQRVNQIVDEKTGKLIRLKNAPIILEGAYCQSRYSGCRMFCPRAIYPYWQEIWLERVSESTGRSGPAATRALESPPR